jgi:hypothetical protein
MKLVLLMAVCQAEERLARDSLRSLVQACGGAQWRLQLVDDASPSHLGQRLAAEWASQAPLGVDLLELPEPRGWHGMAYRLFLGLDRIARWSGGDVDWIVKLDPDALVLREGLLSLLASQPYDCAGLLGVECAMRKRDAALVLADLWPCGFRRRPRGVTMDHDWQLGRWRPVWWTGLGLRALAQGFRFHYIPGGVFFLGGRTLNRIAQRGYLSLQQDGRHGLVFGDDLLLSMAVRAVGDPIVDLGRYHPGWANVSLSPTASVETILAAEYFVVHPLKDNDRDWPRRCALLGAAKVRAVR